MTSTTPHLILTAGDPAGIGPEILLRLAGDPPDGVRLTFIVEPRALEVLRGAVPDRCFDRLEGDEHLRLVDPGADQPWSERTIVPGAPSRGDAHASLAALDLGAHRVRGGDGDALVTAPLSKAEIAQHVAPDFRGHTDYLAQQAGLERYGRDYLMAFLAPQLRVALLSTHLPLRDAIDHVT
ncbi:MAG: 4-hydroxythreonine-4-phosphate dehydrogenase PdxA, partial [Acidobacteriota bacterium]